MLYAGIDQHVRQLTVCVRDETGSVALRRQVSTKPGKVEESLQQLASGGRPNRARLLHEEMCWVAVAQRTRTTDQTRWKTICSVQATAPIRTVAWQTTERTTAWRPFGDRAEAMAQGRECGTPLCPSRENRVGTVRLRLSVK